MFKTGDIIIKNDGAFGHVLMCFVEEDDSGVGDVSFIHGTNQGNFDFCNKLAIEEEKGNYWHFKPNNISEADKVKIMATAEKIKTSAKYGVYRAVRLFLGNSDFGKSAKDRLNKYKKREAEKSDKFITTITCVEAVVICYQVVFSESSPHFIKKDAAHTMPRTLAKYLRETPGGWTMERKPD